MRVLSIGLLFIATVVYSQCVTQWYRDQDQDGFGDPAIAINVSCNALGPGGFVSNKLDQTPLVSDDSTWTFVGAQVSTASSVFTELKVDSDSSLVMMFVDYTSNKLNVARLDASTWTTLGGTNFSSTLYAAESANLEVIGTTPYVAYTDGSVKVMSYDGSTWNNVGVLPSTSNVINTKAAVYNNELFVMYVDGLTNQLNVLKYSSGIWTSVGSSPGTGMYAELEVDNTGAPYIVYSDDNEGGKVSVVKYDGSNWNLVGTAGISVDYAERVDLKINSSGEPYIAYYDNGSGELVVMKFDGNNWLAVGTDLISSDAIDFSLDIDVWDNVYISYVEASSKLVLKKLSGASWNPVLGNQVVPGDISSEHISLALSPEGLPYLSFRNLLNNDYPVVVGITPESIPLQHAVSLHGSLQNGYPFLQCTYSTELEVQHVEWMKLGIDGQFDTFHEENASSGIPPASYLDTSANYSSVVVYKLKIFLNDGGIIYSDAVSVQLPISTVFFVVNPVENNIISITSENSEESEFVLYNDAGKKMSDYISHGERNISWNIYVSPGVYFLKRKNESEMVRILVY